MRPVSKLRFIRSDILTTAKKWKTVFTVSIQPYYTASYCNLKRAQKTQVSSIFACLWNVFKCMEMFIPVVGGAVAGAVFAQNKQQKTLYNTCLKNVYGLIYLKKNCTNCFYCFS